MPPLTSHVIIWVGVAICFYIAKLLEPKAPNERTDVDTDSF